MSQLYTIFPSIKKTEDLLEQQSKFLNKVVLTGKINALDVAANLFETTEATCEGFNAIKQDLIKLLINENLKKTRNELGSKAQVAIDILVRNLYERTADVGFLAAGEVLISFITEQSFTREQIEERLVEYTKKYSVYNEMVIFDTEGKALANMNKQNSIKSSQDPLLRQALSTEEYVEFYGHTDIFRAQEKTLVYAQRILKDEVPIGVICLCFKFEDEMKRVFENLITGEEQIVVLDDNGVMANSNYKGVMKGSDLRFTKGEYQIKNNNLLVYAKTKGYQGYMGSKAWYSVAMHPTIPVINKSEEEFTKEASGHTELMSPALKKIITDAEEIVSDLADVIINGELIASKTQVYVLNPILENLRQISTSILEIIKETVFNLETIVESILYDAKFSAKLAIDIMDRNLYERANDCRWWALAPVFRNELKKEKPVAENMNKVLNYINELYTVYTNLFIYDKNAKIVAASHDRSVIGSTINEDYTRRTLHNKDSQDYYVSDFEKTSFYKERSTYIYNASVVDGEDTIGGIGIVFDSRVEFKAMLEDALPQGRKGFALFADKDKRIISSSTDAYRVGDTLNIDDKYFLQEDLEADFMEFNGKKYVLGVAHSKGYREYKVSDNYSNEVVALTFLEI